MKDYIPTRAEIEYLQKLNRILANGNSAETKRASDGSLVVYEVKKNKR